MTMKIDLTTPNTARLGIWTQNNKTACAASLLTESGETVLNCVSLAGEGLWPVVDEALFELRLAKMRYLLMVCNDIESARQYQYPILIPQPDRAQYKIGKYKEVHNVPSGGCPHMWNILYHTYSYKSWRMVSSQKISVSQRLWEANFGG